MIVVQLWDFLKSIFGLFQQVHHSNEKASLTLRSREWVKFLSRQIASQKTIM